MKLVSVSDPSREYALVPGSNIRDRLPKRFSASLEITVDGSPVSAPVTINRSWSGDSEITLSYPWFLVAGRAYYATLAPGETLEGEYAILEGKASRPDPKRVTVKVETEANRIAAFRATYALRAGPVAPK